MFDAILDITLVYPTSVTKFWAMMCGEFDHVIIDIRKRPLEEWLIAGGYESNREYRRQFHQWLTSIWHEKDDLIDALNRESS